MSGANGAVSDVITLDELERLIKFLGLLGSSQDGEALNAARFAARWLVQHQTDWRTLLTPEEEVGVSGVVAAAEDAGVLLEARLQDAYRRGVTEGMNAMKAQLKAQAAAVGVGVGAQQTAGLGAAQQSPWAGTVSFASGHPAQNMGAMPHGAGLGGGLGAAQQAAWVNAAAANQAAQAGSGGAPAGLSPTNTWKTVAMELLDRHESGIPGVFRGTREEQFVRDVLGRGFRTLTQAQEVWLRDIAGRSGMSW